MIQRAKFYNAIREPLFHHSLHTPQVRGMESILDAWETYNYTDLRWLAYMFGTAYYETGRTIQPVKEGGGASYLTEMYDITGKRPALAKAMGNTLPGDGILYCGRGYVQLTWKCLYDKIGNILKLDLVNKPDLAMLPENAALIMLEGMTKAKTGVGDFTGVSLEKYFNDKVEDWYNARRVINGTDRATEIATISKLFLEGLKSAQ